MTCPRCGYWKSRGAKFCSDCGADLSDIDNDKCQMCDYWRSMGATYCSACGRYLGNDGQAPEPPPTDEHPFLRTVVRISTIIVSICAVLAVLVAVVNIEGIVEAAGTFRMAYYFPLGLEDITLFNLQGTAIQVYACIDIAVLALFTYYAISAHLRTLKEEGRYGDRSEHTGMSAASSALCVSLFLSVAYLMLTQMAGAGVDTSWMDDYDDYQMAFMLYNAGVQEEICYRVFLIGIPMVVAGYAIWRKRGSWKYLLGGFGMSKAAFVLIVFSSLLFGLAHESGWGWSKVLDAMIGGVIFGYLYCEYGLYAGCIAHMVNDTLSLIPLGILPELAMIALGLIVLIYWIMKPNRGAVDFRGMRAFAEEPPPLRDVWKRD